jgi:hypothetical protein
VNKSNRTWWQLNYDVTPDGWSAQYWLEKVAASQVLGATSQASPASVDDQIRVLRQQIADLTRQLTALLATQ